MCKRGSLLILKWKECVKVVFNPHPLTPSPQIGRGREWKRPEFPLSNVDRRGQGMRGEAPKCR